MSLSPSIDITLRFQQLQPEIAAADLPLLLIGVCRRTLWKETATEDGTLVADGGVARTYRGGATNAAYPIPGIAATDTMEQITATPTELRPRVYLSTPFGTEEVAAASLTYSYTAKTVTIATNASLVFEVADGVGTYDPDGTTAVAAAEGTFVDDASSGIDFLAVAPGTDEALISVGSSIEINDVPTFLVEGIQDSTTLEVSKVDKGSGSVNADLTVATDGLRTLTSADAEFTETGVKVGDRVEVHGFAILDQTIGGAFPGGSGAQDLTDPDADFTAAPAVADASAAPSVATATFDYVTLVSGNNRTPTGYITDPDPESGDETKVEITPFTGTLAANVDAAYAINRLGAARVLATSGSVKDVGAWTVTGSTLTAGTSPLAGDVSQVGDVFCDGTTGLPLYVVLAHTAESDTYTVTPLYSGAATSGAAGYLRPGVGYDDFDVDGGGDNLRIVNVHDQTVALVFVAPSAAGTAVTAAVTGNEEDGFVVTLTALNDSEVSHIVTAVNALTTVGIRAVALSGSDPFDDAIASTDLSTTGQVRVVNGGGAYTAHAGGGAPAGQRALTSVGNNFTTTIDDADTEYTDDATAPIVYNQVDDSSIFFVRKVVDDNTLYVEDIVSGTPASGSASTDFRFYVKSAVTGSLDVVAVVSDTVLQVENAIAGDPPDDEVAYSDLWYRVVHPDSPASFLEDLSYSIKRTVTGASLTGDVLVTYTARRGDLGASLLAVQKDANSGTYWKDLLGHAVPINPLAMAADVAFTVTNREVFVLGVAAETLAAYTDALVVAEDVRAYVPIPLTQDADVAALLETHLTQQSEPTEGAERISYFSSLEIEPSVSASFSADTVTATKTNATTTLAITSRDISASIGVGYAVTYTIASVEYTGAIVSFSVPVTGQTSIVLTQDPDLAVGAGQSVTDFEITTPVISLSQRATQQAAISTAIAERRFRNVYPASCVYTITDDTAGDDAADGEGFYGGGDQDVALGGQFIAVAAGAMRTQLPPQIPMASLTAPRFVSLDDSYAGNRTLRNRIIDAGTTYFFRNAAGAIETYRALTTDVSDLKKVIDTMDPQRDKYVKTLRAALNSFKAKRHITPTLLSDIRLTVTAVNNKSIAAGELLDAKITSVLQSTASPDRVAVKAQIFTSYDLGGIDVEVLV